MSIWPSVVVLQGQEAAPPTLPRNHTERMAFSNARPREVPRHIPDPELQTLSVELPKSIADWSDDSVWCIGLCAVWDSWSGSGLSMPPSLTKDPYSGQVLDCSVQRAHYCSSLLTGGPRRPFHCWLGQHLYCRGPYFTINHMQCSDFLTYLCFVTFQHLSLEGPNP